MRRRLFLQALGLAGWMPDVLSGHIQHAEDYYALPVFGNATLMHFSDCHAQLLPVYFREPAVNIGTGESNRQGTHLTGQEWLRFFGVTPGTRAAYAFTHLNFTDAAHAFGKMGGFAHLATLIHKIRAERGAENTLLLDGGDTWQGSATALWTQGRDMLQVCNALGVDVMTGHWEFTYGSAQLLRNIAAFQGRFVAHNIAWREETQFDSDATQVFEPYTIRQLPGTSVAVIGQAFPYTPIANPPRFTPDWRFGIEEAHLQQIVNSIRQRRQAEVIVLLSHNGMDVDLKLASRVGGLDFILGGHTHGAVPRALPVSNAGGTTWVTNAGSHGKFLAVLDLQVKAGRLADFRYRLLPVFSELLTPDAAMQTLIDTLRAPFLEELQKPLAVTAELLYRRDNFHGSFDQVLLDAQRTVNQTQLALSPGFRWGASLLPGETISVEDVYNQTAITYPETYRRIVTGAELKAILEDVCDNLFNPDPYYRQGGDMVRCGGMRYVCDPAAPFGRRIAEMRLDNGELMEADKNYTLSGWAAVGQVQAGKPIWQITSEYLQSKQNVHFESCNRPVVRR
ncbi:MAG: thiosulfohydrolase SoxB [Gammaproteobacteria bacterium]